MASINDHDVGQRRNARYYIFNVHRENPLDLTVARPHCLHFQDTMVRCGVENLDTSLFAHPILFLPSHVCMLSAQNTTYGIFLLRKSFSGCIANLVPSVELTYDNCTGVRQESRSSAKTGDKALHMQLADRFGLLSSVSFGGLPSYAAFH